MDVRETIQKTLDHIEEHLHTDLTLEDLASVVSYSAYHFHRLFQMTVGISVMTYIKKRRLDRAAQELLLSDRKILDIALDVGFSCHETFSRAFKRTFQQTPVEYRKAGDDLAFFPRIRLMELNLSTLGGIEMKVTIVEKPEMKILGYAVRTSNNNDRGMHEIPAFWQRYLQEGLRNTIPNKLNPNVELGVCVDFNPGTGDFSYLIGYEIANVPDLTGSELIVRTIPAATYAVFTTEPTTREKFSEVIQGTWQQAFQNWFPTSGYQHAGTPDFEWYDDRSDGPENMVMDIYIPIVKQTVTTS